MIKTSLFGLLLAGSTLAAAQTVAPAPVPAPTTPPAATPSGTQPATPATPAQPADPAADTAAVPATPATPASPALDSEAPNAGTVQSTVDAEWASYDANGNSQLSRTEFDKWVTALQSAAGGKAPTRGYLTSAFKKADADKSGGVSKSELVTFLGS